MKKKIMVPLYNSIHHDLDCKTIDQAIEVLKGLKEYYDPKEVTIQYDSEDGVELYESRDETDAEYEERLQKENAYSKRIQEHKLAQYEALKKELNK